MESEAIKAAKRSVYMSGEVYIPDSLYGKIEFYVLPDGDVGIRPIKKKKKKHAST